MFVLAISNITGRKQRIPQHWLSDPELGPQFRTPGSPPPAPIEPDPEPATTGRRHRRASAEKE